MVNEDMVRNAYGALVNVLGARRGERLFIVTDNGKKEISKAFIKAAKKLGLYVTHYLLDEGERPYIVVPQDLSKKIEGRDMILNIFSAESEETPFRVSLVKKECFTSARVGHAPGITEDMMTEGAMAADFAKVISDSEKLLDNLDDAVEATITAPGGTNITLDLTKRPFLMDAKISRGGMGNLPAGEIYCAPVEEGANGTIVCDAVIGDLGPVESPVTIRVEAGVLKSVESEDADMVKRIENVLDVDEMARVIGELGIGLNDKARLTGNLLEDEKARHTAHIAFGNNEGMTNGKNRSSTHRDFLFHNPTVVIKYANGTTVTLIEDGKLTL